jgi:CHRD domain
MDVTSRPRSRHPKKENVVRMRQWMGWSVAVLLVVAGAACGRAVAQGGRPISIALTGAAEVPGPGDADGSGRAQLTLNPGKGEICYTLRVAGIGSATAAHIHRAVSGQAGPVLVTLKFPAAAGATECVIADKELVRNILQNPSNYYVNVQTADFPAGAIRGQLSR